MNYMHYMHYMHFYPNTTLIRLMGLTSQKGQWTLVDTGADVLIGLSFQRDLGMTSVGVVNLAGIFIFSPYCNSPKIEL